MAKAMKAWAANDQKIEEHNSKGLSFKMAHNAYSGAFRNSTAFHCCTVLTHCSCCLLQA